MKRTVLWMALSLVLTVGGNAQQQAEQVLSDDQMRLRDIPVLQLPEGYALKSLPVSLDNTIKPYFPEVFNQYGWSCNQASSIGYVFTYEINAARNLSATMLENLYPPLSIWNFLNNSNSEKGVSFFDSWEAVRMNGVPSFLDFGYDNYHEKKWMSGYDKYYRGMKNRTKEMFTINTDTEEGILTLKHWLKDHLNGSANGGLASFQIGSDAMRMQLIPEGEAGAGSYLITIFDPRVGHALTVVGYDDQVRWDFNHDGQYTNDIDLNGDGILDIRDHEIGAFLVVNSWGADWGDKGRAYAPYRLFAMGSADGGIWEKCVTVIKPRAQYAPQLTFKIGLTYTKRTQLKIVAGMATNTSSDRPEHVLEFPMFNYSGGYLPMQGHEGENSGFIEIGLDVSPLLAWLNPDQQAKFFLEVYHQQQDEAAGQGKVNYFSVLDYGLGQAIETTSPVKDENIRIDAVTRLFAFVTPKAGIPQIDQDELPQAEVGKGYIRSLTASGGTAPYTFSKNDGQYVAHERNEPWVMPSGAEKLLGISDSSRLKVDLGFAFTFYGKTYTEAILLKDGGLVFGDHIRDYPYVIDKRLYTYQNPGIFPLFTDLEYSFIGDGVYRKDVDDGVIFAWDATLSKYAGLYDPKFGIKLCTNGEFFFGFNQMALTAEWDWISVVSAGDQIHYTLTDLNFEGLWRGQKTYDFRLFDWPEWLFLTDNGGLLGTPPPGAYSTWLTFSVSDANGLTGSKSLFLDVKGGLGVEQPSVSVTPNIYPNPVTDDLFIDQLSDQDITKVQVFSSTGRLLMEQDVESGQNKLRLSFRHLPEGIYFVKAGQLVQKVIK